MGSSREENYRYWQENGGSWPEFYRERKTRQVHYHIQELYLLDYFLNSGPVKVLEFGCGYGRHLRNLAPLNGLEVYGHDQSPTMLEGMKEWADPAWMESHVTLGEPVGRLPYEDDFFDVVYTAEVLVHVRPQDLAAVLKELIRVSRWQVLHLETAPQAELNPETHGGCWKHDLAAAYRELGHEVQELGQCYHQHLPSRVLLDPSRPPYDMPPALAAKLADAEKMLQPTIDQGCNALLVVEKKNEQLDIWRDHLAAKRVEVQNLERILDNMNVRVNRLEKEQLEAQEEHERRIVQADQKIAWLEQLVGEYKDRIAALEEEASFTRMEAKREITRWKGRAHYLEQGLRSNKNQDPAGNLTILQEKMLNLLDKYNLQQIHLERMAADRALYMERYNALLQSLDELAGWGNR